MNDTSPLRPWLMRLAFLVVALAVLLGNLLPLQTVPRGWAGPDLLLLFAMVWSVRRPDYVPVPLLALVFLLGDLLLGRPPGLAAALMLLACFDLQKHALSLRDSGFFAEWTRAAFLLVGIALAQRFVLALMLLDLPPLGLSAVQLALTALFYPVAVGISAVIFGVRLSAPGDLNAIGPRR